MSATAIGFARWERAQKIQISLQYIFGIPGGLLLTFFFDITEGGFWVGLAAASISMNIVNYAVYSTTNYKSVVREINARFPYQPLSYGTPSEYEEEEESDEEAEPVAMQFRFRSITRGSNELRENKRNSSGL